MSQLTDACINPSTSNFAFHIQHAALILLKRASSLALQQVRLQLQVH